VTGDISISEEHTAGKKYNLQGGTCSVLGLSSRDCLLSNTDSPSIMQFQVTQFQTYRVLRDKNMTEWHFRNEHKVFTCGNERAMRQKCQENSAAWYHRQWGNYAAVDVFQCIKVWISTEPPSKYVYVWPYVYLICTCTKFYLSWIFRNVTTV